MSAEFDSSAEFDLNASFHWPVRVYWEDTDAGGVVYYANYLKFMERARSEWLRALGFEQDELRRSAGVMFVVRKVEVDYLSPARFNDEIDVDVSVHEVGRASLSVKQTLTRGSTRLVSAKVRLACVDALHFKPVKIPSLILQALAQET
ncbi:MAG: tol-pal system-associated acyl-CoA thioesterase [Sulfuriferula multivorans]|uniref:Tol-pal system-associated acyl-CoA thioesterase n=1 Tax=Sulfuriferula multivorans TaxID=1559896 RepID=A0A7C9P773_9PROT|nr:tol-pal system-associated acyl-CoA thioesterase [Sulfuriferula multivorans]